MSFFAAGFAVAGAIAALGPILIHLLNQRRYRTVNWAAMDFLREALKRNRRFLQLRDLLLLALRTACVLLFGLALARPYFAGRDDFQSNAPVHAVLVVDNSLSMGYRPPQAVTRDTSRPPTLLDEAKARGREFIESLPEGSVYSVLPLCEAAHANVYRTPEGALAALEAIQAVDRAGSALRAAELAEEAAQLAPERPTKRIVFLGDQQRSGWPRDSLAERFPSLAEMQVVSLAPAAPSNVWISDFRIQDGLADLQTDARFLCTVEYRGEAPRRGVQVTLSVEGEVVSTQVVDLVDGQARQIAFAPYRFADIETEPGQPVFLRAEVAVADYEWDDLPRDNQRYLAVPVVRALPVVFVDEYGSQEKPQQNQYGSTFHLRRLLAPLTSRTEAQQQLVQVVHKQMVDVEELDLLDDEELRDPQTNFLREARLVVIAGVERPGDGAVRVLRQYVQQGGQLLIAAGGKFDPAAWNEVAWLDGAGILPAPLLGDPIGKTIDESLSTGEYELLELEFASLTHDDFLVPGVPHEQLKDLYAQALFFKTVVCDAGQTVRDALLKSQQEWIARQRQRLAEAQQKLAEYQQAQREGTLTQADAQQRDELRRQIAQLDPQWLRLRRADQADDAAAEPAELARRQLPRVLADYTRQHSYPDGTRPVPFLVQRRIGQGNVTLCASSVYSDWSTLSRTNAVVMFDRLCRGAIGATLPAHNFEATPQITLPLDTTDRRAIFSLYRPGSDMPEELPLAALGPTQEGLVVRDALRRGHYRIVARSADASADESITPPLLWQTVLAVNSPREGESEPEFLTREEFHERLGHEAVDRFGWVERGEPISLQGPGSRGHDLWWWLVGLVLAGMLLEVGILAWPAVRQRPVPAR